MSKNTQRDEIEKRLDYSLASIEHAELKGKDGSQYKDQELKTCKKCKLKKPTEFVWGDVCSSCRNPNWRAKKQKRDMPSMIKHTKGIWSKFDYYMELAKQRKVRSLTTAKNKDIFPTGGKNEEQGQNESG